MVERIPVYCKSGLVNPLIVAGFIEVMRRLASDVAPPPHFFTVLRRESPLLAILGG